MTLNSFPAPTNGVHSKKQFNLFLSARILLWFSGIALLIWAFVSTQFRDSEGFLKGTICLPVAASLGLIVWGWGIVGSNRGFAFWFALAIVGQAAALQTVNAGPMIHYQHYKSLNRLLSEGEVLPVLILAFQVILVVIGTLSRWPAVRTWITNTLNIWQRLGIGLIFFLSSAALSRSLLAYVGELFFATLVQTANLANIFLMACAVPEDLLIGARIWISRIIGSSEGDEKNEPIGVDKFAVIGALWILFITASLNILIYERHPHVEDEVIYFYHARYLAAGELTTPAPAIPEAFSIYMIPYRESRWYSPFPPGWPAMLALGVLVRAPWLVNPILAGVNILLAYALLRNLFPKRFARIAVLLLCISPWFIFMGMNFMSHTFMLTCALAATIGVLSAIKTGSLGWAALAGTAVGLLGMIRPLDGITLAGLLGLLMLSSGKTHLRVLPAATFALFAAILGGVMLLYNQRLTGEPLTFPLNAYYDTYYSPRTFALGFGPDRGLNWAIDPYPGYSPIEAVINALLNVFSINIELFGWGTGSLLLISLLIFSGNVRKIDSIMLVFIASTAGLYALFWFSGGPDFGARYWYLMLIPLIFLSVRGIQVLIKWFPSSSGDFNQPSERVIVALLCLCSITLFNYLPWRALDKYHRYLGMSPEILHLADEYRFDKSLVFIQGASHPDYESAWVYNPLDLSANTTLYVFDQDPLIRKKVLQAYPGRPVWFVAGPTITKGQYRVVAGPLSAEKAVRITSYEGLP